MSALDQPPDAPAVPDDAWRDLFLGTMEEVGRATGDLRAELLAIGAAAAKDDGQPGATAAALAQTEPHLDREFGRVNERIAAASEQLMNNGPARNRYGAYLMGITTRVERVQHSWPRTPAGGADPDPRAIAKTATDLLTRLEDAMYEVGQIIVPPQVSGWAAQMHVGDVLDFDARFKTELPTPELRKRMLEWLAEARASAPGIVDVENGQIRVAAVSRRDRVTTWLRLGAGVIGSLALAFFLPRAAGIASTADGPAWLANIAGLASLSALTIFGAMLVGAIGHLVVDVLKQSRTEKEKALRSLRDLSLWAHVHETHLWLALGTLFALFVLYVAVEGPPTLWIAAVVGYSWDSVFDVLLGRFTVALDKKVQDVKKAVTPAAA